MTRAAILVRQPKPCKSLVDLGNAKLKKLKIWVFSFQTDSTDHGNGLFWWYYEGPKGTWWMDEREHAEPEPYPVDPVEEISSEDA